MTRLDTGNKYRAKRTHSQLCGREFASHAEATRAEELYLLERVGQITDLKYQVPFILCQKPKITITIDFSYNDGGETIYEDTKGVLTRDFRTKLAWLKEKFNITVRLTR